MTLSLAEVDILSLIRADAGDLRRKSNTPHAEWCGACPWCGGRDRFIVWPEPRKGNPRYWCRQCGKRGDAIAWLRERESMTFAEACRALSIETERQSLSAPTLRPPDLGIEPPPHAWQDLARAFVDECAAALWTPRARPALAWLRARGLTDDTIERAGLGFNPEPRDSLPVGVVIPWRVRGCLVAVKVRQSDAALARNPKAGKYVHRGGAGNPNAWLYNADALDPERAAVLVESELDALAIEQAAGDLVVAVATGGAESAKRVTWRARLALAESVLVAFDLDDGGDKGAAYWQDLANAARWRPERHDPGDMLRHDGALAVRRWIADGLAVCAICGAPIGRADGRYTPDGWPLCDAHSVTGGEPSQIEAGLELVVSC